ncbi:MAG: hypothetical protein IPO63_02815 [Bacteroidetes bacterium]|nr:hypothetical protein [Bacteroidota bacterium]
MNILKVKAIVTFLLILISSSSFCQTETDDRKSATDELQDLSLLVHDTDSISAFREIIFNAKHNPKYKNFEVDTLVSNQEVAISICEPILFKIYGKDRIVRQRPYGIHKVDGFWIINGSSKNTNEENFLIIIDAKNSAVLKCTTTK